MQTILGSRALKFAVLHIAPRRFSTSKSMNCRSCAASGVKTYPGLFRKTRFSQAVNKVFEVLSRA